MTATTEGDTLPARLDRVYGETPTWLEATSVPGLAVVLLEHGKMRGSLYFGTTVLGGEVAVTSDTVFAAASLSKQAFLYAALKTIEAGRLDLDRPLAEYLREPYGIDDSQLGLITARHVLTHTTGWRNWPPKDQPIEREDAPGMRWGYSGQGFLYLQEALAAIWGESPESYIRRLTLDPLGMSRSGFVWRDEYERNLAVGHHSNGSDVDIWKSTEVNAASSLFTTAREYTLLLEQYLDRELQKRHPDVYARQIPIIARIGWTLGWGIADDILWQWGHNTGYKSFAALAVDRGLGIACFANGERAQRIHREWVNAWLDTDLPAFYFRSVDL